MCNIFSHGIEVGPKNYDINRNRAVQYIAFASCAPSLSPSFLRLHTAECRLLRSGNSSSTNVQASGQRKNSEFQHPSSDLTDIRCDRLRYYYYDTTKAGGGERAQVDYSTGSQHNLPPNQSTHPYIHGHRLIMYSSTVLYIRQRKRNYTRRRKKEKKNIVNAANVKVDVMQEGKEEENTTSHPLQCFVSCYRYDTRGTPQPIFSQRIHF